MTPYLTEEAVESAEAIASTAIPRNIAEELGDLAFLGVFCLELLVRAGAGSGSPRRSSEPRRS